MKKPHFGWFYNRYFEYENQFIQINQHIPLSDDINDSNYKFGSPSIVNLHVQLGTMIDSTFKTYSELIKGKFPKTININKKTNFVQNVFEFNKIKNLTSIKLKLKDHPIYLYPFKLIYNRPKQEIKRRGKIIIRQDKRPEWYCIYSTEKHDLLRMEELTNLEQLLRTLGAFYILTVLHPDNWYSIEFDWDSKIFDKYSIGPYNLNI